MTQTIELNGRSVVYEFSRKKIKNINVRIRTDGSVAVSAGMRYNFAEVEAFMRLKADFILKALDKFSARVKNADSFCDGGTVRFLGEEKRVTVKESQKNFVCLDGADAVFYIKSQSNATLESLWNAFIKKKCLEILTSVCEKLFPFFAEKGCVFPVIKTRKMKSMWGSCNKCKNSVCFRDSLVETPYECVEYVAAHELCHLLVPDHSKRFYSLLSKVIPCRKQKEKLLETFSFR